MVVDKAIFLQRHCHWEVLGLTRVGVMAMEVRSALESCDLWWSKRFGESSE